MLESLTSYKIPLSQNPNVFIVGFDTFYENLVNNLRNASAKMAFLAWRSSLLPISSQIYSIAVPKEYDDRVENITKFVKPFEGRMPLKLEQNILHFPIAFGITKYNFLIRHVNKIIPWLLQAGIIQHLRKSEQVDEVEEIEEVKVLTYGDLEFGFILWLASCGIAALGYLIEIITLFILYLKQKHLIHH
jgi:hypothetical protein